jgi:nucleotide-binding universal stress UspA family protein
VPADQQWTINPRDKALALLNRAAERARGAGVVEIEAHPREGDAADAILDVAEEHGCDLIVVGHRGMTGAKRFLLGSVPNKISHHAPCSVLIIRTG